MKVFDYRLAGVHAAFAVAADGTEVIGAGFLRRTHMLVVDGEVVFAGDVWDAARHVLVVGKEELHQHRVELIEVEATGRGLRNESGLYLCVHSLLLQENGPYGPS